MLPLLTVFIPAYNAASYIRDAIESVISTIEDMEIVVVDDCSTDDTVERVEQITASRDKAHTPD